MDPKPKPNRRLYIEALRRMTPEQRLMMAMEMGERERQAMRDGIRRQFPGLDDKVAHAVYMKCLVRCVGPPGDPPAGWIHPYSD